MSKIQICNRALSTYLGSKRINAIDEATPEAEQCQLHYDDALRTVIESHEWGFATTRKKLAQLVNDRPGEWDYKYQRPVDAVTVIWVNDEETARIEMAAGNTPDADRETSEDFIYSNTPTATCQYVRLITDPTKYSQKFRNAVSAELASNMALTLTEDIKRTRNALEFAMLTLDDAIAHDEAQEYIRRHDRIADSLAVRGIR